MPTPQNGIEDISQMMIAGMYVAEAHLLFLNRISTRVYLLEWPRRLSMDICTQMNVHKEILTNAFAVLTPSQSIK